jgi:hypothetical protein
VASLSVIAYISQNFPAFRQLPSNELIHEAYSASLFHPASTEVATTLSLLALSLSVGSELTPGVEAPSPRNQQRFLQRAVDGLGADALGDPNLGAFIVVRIASGQLVNSLATMVSLVRKLVGTMDFGKEDLAIAKENTSVEVV